MRWFVRIFAAAISIGSILIGSIFIQACASAKESKKQKNVPYLMRQENAILLNTFSLGSGEFPILTGLSELPAPPDYKLLPRDKMIALINERFKQYGFVVQPDYAFSYGKIHVSLTGYDPRLCAGFALVFLDDYEESKLKAATSSKMSRGLFFTKKDVSKYSASELLLLEQLNQQEQVYIALINAHQFALPVDANAADMQKMFETLDARIKLYLRWVEARIELRRQKPEEE